MPGRLRIAVDRLVRLSKRTVGPRTFANLLRSLPRVAVTGLIGASGAGLVRLTYSNSAGAKLAL